MVDDHDPTAGRSGASRLMQSMAQAGEFVAVIDHDLRIVAADPGFVKTLELDPNHGAGGHPVDHHPLYARSIFAGPVRTALRDRQAGSAVGWSEVWQAWLSVRAYPVQEGLLLCCMPIERHDAHTGAGQVWSRLDTMTSLPNRTAFDADVHLAIDDAEPFTVGLLDLDDFKAINGNFGYRGGDRVLTRLASEMKRCLHPGDRLYRISGDEFASLVFATGDEAGRRLDALRQAAASVVTIGVTQVGLTASLGHAAFPCDGRSVDDLHRRAEMALYEAMKTPASGRLAFTSALENRLLTHGRLSADLSRAIGAGQLCLVYQPQVDLKTGAITGIEALVRWEHPEFGLMTPDRFLPIAAELGLMPAVDDWVSGEVMRDLPAILATGFDGQVSINLSAESLALPNLAERLSSDLERDPRFARHLEFEITESAMMRDIEQGRTTIGTLRAIGLSIALDDFGTGYSSFGYLMSLPCDVVKIDRIFIRGLADDDRSFRLVRGMLRLLHSMELKVVAEGAESGEQQAILEALGCDRMQGFQFSRPLPLSALLRRLDA